jgi:hypothetical protein
MSIKVMKFSIPFARRLCRKNEARKLIFIFGSSKHFRAALADGAFDSRGEIFPIVEFSARNLPPNGFDVDLIQ